MFIENEQIDEVFISDHLLNSVLGWSILDEEKQKLKVKHADTLAKKKLTPSFCIDSVSSSINFFSPLTEKKLSM